MEVLTFIVEEALTLVAVLDSFPLVEERTYLVALNDLVEDLTEEASSLVDYLGNLVEVLTAHP